MRKAFIITLSLAMVACSADQASTTESSVTVYSANASTAAVLTSSCTTSATQKQLLALVNRARASARYCGVTQYPAVSPLSWNCALAAAAQGHADDMATYSFLDHFGSDGLTSGDRISAQGYIASAWAENVAAGQSSEQEVIDDWLASDGHCENIMSGDVIEVGAAVSINSATGRHYWVQDYASPLQ